MDFLSTVSSGAKLENASAHGRVELTAANHCCEGTMDGQYGWRNVLMNPWAGGGRDGAISSDGVGEVGGQMDDGSCWVGEVWGIW